MILLILSLLAIFPALAMAMPKTAAYSAELNASALQQAQTAVLAVVFDVAPGLHAQSHQPLDSNLIPFVVSADPNPAVDFLAPVYPLPKTLSFGLLGPQSVYTGHVVVFIPIRVKPDAPLGDITLTGKLTWQACNDSACFPPQTNQPFTVATKIVAAIEQVTPQYPATFSTFDQSIFAQNAPPVAAPLPSDTGTILDFFGRHFALASTSVPLALLIALVVGILFNLMPCVLPVVPLKIIGFLEVSRQNRARCFLLGAVFSLGVLAAFAVLAWLIVVLHHFEWGEFFRYGWFVWTMVAILVVMSAGMFGLFEVALPNSVYNLSPSHESIFGNFLFGILAALLSTPCTAPMFAGLLAWALKQPTILGVSALMTVGFGMALPYLILSAFPNLARWVPRTGPWSAVLKQMMGFLVLAVAVYFAGGQLSSTREFFWFVFAIVAAGMAFLVVRTAQLSPHPVPIIVTTSIALIVVWISLSFTQRVTGGLDWQTFTPQALSDARATGQPVLVEFTANWCPNCLTLEATVFHDKETAAAVHSHKVILLRADLTSTDAPGWKAVNELNPGGGIPLTAIYSPHTDDPIKLTSLYTTQNLLDALDRAGPG